jgi:ParB/RepB/Spo0J family partition protein
MSAEIDWNAIRARLAEAFAASGKSQRGLAAEADVAQSQLSEFLATKPGRGGSIDIEKLRRLCQILGLDFAGMLGIEGGGGVETVPLGMLDPHPRNPRGRMDPDALDDLAKSIGTMGILVPLLVKRGEAGRYTVIAGHRRMEAMKLQMTCAEPGLWPVEIDQHYAVPVVVLDLASETDELYAQLAENTRADMHPLDEGLAYRRLQEAGEATAQIATRSGASQRKVQSRIQLTKRLVPLAVDMFRGGGMTLAHAETMAKFGPAIQSDFLVTRTDLLGLTEHELRAALDGHTSEMAGPTGDEAEKSERRSPPPPPPPKVEIAGPAETPREPAGPAPLTQIIKADPPPDQLPEFAPGWATDAMEIIAGSRDGDGVVTSLVVHDGRRDVQARFDLNGDWA